MKCTWSCSQIVRVFTRKCRAIRKRENKKSGELRILDLFVLNGFIAVMFSRAIRLFTRWTNNTALGVSGIRWLFTLNSHFKQGKRRILAESMANIQKCACMHLDILRHIGRTMTLRQSLGCLRPMDCQYLLHMHHFDTLRMHKVSHYKQISKNGFAQHA